MQRKLFLFLEKLQISRRERVAIGCLSGVLVVLSILNLALEQRAVYDQAYYEDLERIFNERSRIAETERREILTRYDPPGVEEADTVSGSSENGTGHGGSTRGEGEKKTPQQDRESTAESGIEGERGTDDAGRVNINTAGSGKLQELPGIGPAYAGRILERRRETGPFTSVGELIEVRGIGVKRLADLKPLVTVGDSSEK